uniref:Myb-like domain-containing protein n=1 Tax=Spongospora subterranea TaxID=70186 RepID=A0A0H5R1U6_9EUKA|eukprot:CRZ08180.1 hypothetical protein [Spongospora subterranea]
MNDSVVEECVAPGATKKAGRGKSWKDEENLALTRAVGSVGYDSINGVDQKGTVYWEKVSTSFVARGGSSDRTQKALKNRWSVLQTAINLFIGYYSTATSIERSGSNDEDYLQFAHDLFEKEQNVSFEFESCWRALQAFGDKWKVITSPLAAKRERAVLEGVQGSQDGERPLGCKAAKKNLLGDKREDESRQQLLKVKQDIAASQTRRNELLQEQNELALFSIVVRDDDHVGAQYLALKKQQALENLKAQLPKNSE